MALELKQSLRLSQQLVMTPQLQQAIKLLQLNRMELAELITQELVENPILEESADSYETSEDGQPLEQTDSTRSDPEAEQKRDEEANLPVTDPQQEAANKLNEDFNWDSYIEDFNSSSSSLPSMKEVNDELPSFENVLTRSTSLEDHLSWQLSMIVVTDTEKKFAELIIGNLSDDGYLTASAEDLAKEAQLDLEDAEEVLKMIRKFDPIGVSSRNLKECLQTQAELMNPRQEVVEKIIADHLANLEKKNYSAIAKALGLSLDEVITATKILLEFEPKPGRSFHAPDTHYITPDIYVYKVGNEYVISLNEDGLPKLKISPYYKSILSGAKNEGTKITKEYVQEKLRSAMWLIRSIHNRQKTIYKVTEAVVQRQKDFFEKGSQYLRPMILKDVANDIGMHESTISRVTTNKFVHTPIGIFELKYFFNSSINSTDGTDAVASESVKEKIKQLITREDPKNPLSDQKIVELLKDGHIDIARRTVAKYREMLGILSSSKRKKIF